MTRSTIGARLGFTLIELLIVVAIIAILAAIAVPNFLEAQTRAKVTRAIADMRSLTTAFETYRIDNNRYPPRPLDPANRDSVTLVREGPFERGISYSFITTPVAYMTSVPIDPFENDLTGSDNALGYWDNYQTEEYFLTDIGRGGFLQYSIGPDTGAGWGNAGVSYGFPEDKIPGSFRTKYDTTNGTISLGNIFRLSGNQNPPGYLTPPPAGGNI